MGETPGVVRTNISVPRDLKARMDAAGERVNWSAVAAQAFEAKLLELESRKGVETMEDVIARMRAADELEGKEDYQAGRKAGEEWARNDARPKQLRRLDEMANDYNWYGSGGILSACADGTTSGLALHLYCAVEGVNWQEHGDADDVKAFWHGALGGGGEDKIDGYHFGRGFVEGALNVWEKVKDAL